MKKMILLTAAVAMLTAGLALAEHPTEHPAKEHAAEPWFDMDNCGMCKNLHNDEELFNAMQWDTKLFAQGLVEITTVPAAYEERFQKLMASMEATGAKMMAGEEMPMCRMCQSYGGLMMAGASMEQMQAGEAHISVISSADPAVIKKIRAHGETTIEEMKKWMAAEGEHGHDHKH